MVVVKGATEVPITVGISKMIVCGILGDTTHGLEVSDWIYTKKHR